MPLKITGSGGGGRGGVGVPEGGATGTTAGALAAAAAQSGVLRARGRSATGPQAIPVLMDAFPKEWDSAEATRILDNVVRQLTAVREGPGPAAKVAAESDDAEVLAWLL